MIRRVLAVALALAATAACGDGGPSSTTGPRLTITSAPALPAATVGAPYDVTLTASGGNPAPTWRVSSGALPGGLQLSAAGQLTGTPGAAGSHSFTVEAASGAATAAVVFSLRVDEAPLLILTTALPDAILGAAYSRFLDVEPGDGTAAWTVASGSLPAGLALAASGVITGNATTLGGTSFRLRVTRGTRSGERDFTLAVVPPPLAITTPSLPPGEVGLAYESQLESSGGVGGNTWDLVAGRLPLGLALSPAGVVSGTPVGEEVQQFTVRLVSGTQAVTRVLTMAVAPSSYVTSADVDMPADAFTPFLVKLLAGGTVTWRFPSREHNVIFVPAAGVPADIQITSNTSVTRTFTSPGFFRYDCTIHPGMSGQVVVR